MNSLRQDHASLMGEKRLVRELSWVLIVKTIALFLLWLAFFSKPVDVFLTETHIYGKLFSTSVIETDQLSTNF